MVSDERRRALQVIGGVGITSIAGCLGLGDSTDDNGNTTNSSTTSPTLGSLDVEPYVDSGDKQAGGDWRNTNWVGGTPLTEKPTTAWRNTRRFEFGKIRTGMTVKNNSVYYSSGNLQLLSVLDTETGELKETHSPALSDPLTPVVHANRVFLSTGTPWSDPLGAVYLLENGETGIAWKNFFSFTPDSDAEMTVYRTDIFVPGINGSIGVFDVTKPILRETIQTGGVEKVIGSPAVNSDLIVVGGGSVAEVYDKVTKSLLWSVSVENHHAPIVSGSGVIFTSPTGLKVYEIPSVSREKEEVEFNGTKTNADGEPITPHVLTDASAPKVKNWEKTVSNEITSIAATNSRIHVTISPDSLGGVDTATNTSSSNSSAMQSDGDTIVRTYDTASGDVAWETIVVSSDIIRSVVHQSVLYVIGSERITGLNIATGEVIWEYQPPAEPQPPITVTDNKLIYRMNENELIAITD